MDVWRRFVKKPTPCNFFKKRLQLRYFRWILQKFQEQSIYRTRLGDYYLCSLKFLNCLLWAGVCPVATEWKCMSKINSKDTSCFLFNFSESIPLPANIYLFKVTIEILKKGEKHVQINKKDTNERRQWRCSRVFIVISNLSHTFF